MIKQGGSLFEQIKQIDENGNEFWFARQLAKVLEYADFRNFIGVINKAKEACIKGGQEVSEHLVEANEVLPERIQIRGYCRNSQSKRIPLSA